MVRVWHPDRFGNDPELQRTAHDKLAKINEAVDTLKSGVFTAADFTTEDSSKSRRPQSQPQRQRRSAPADFATEALSKSRPFVPAATQTNASAATPPARCHNCGVHFAQPGILTPGPLRLCPSCMEHLIAVRDQAQRERDMWASTVVVHLLALACCIATVVMILYSFIAG